MVDYFCFLAVAKKCREKILFTCSFMKGVWLFFFLLFFWGVGLEVPGGGLVMCQCPTRAG